MKEIENTFQRDEGGVLEESKGYTLEKIDNGAGIWGWVVRNKKENRMWVGNGLTFRSAVSIFKALTSGKPTKAEVEIYDYEMRELDR